MKPPELLADLRARGVRVTLESGELRLRGSSQVLGPRVLEVARRLKPALCELLALEAANGGPQVLAGSSTCGLPVGAPSTPHPASYAQRQRARELGQILNAFPGACLLKSGAWRIEGQRIEHAGALALIEPEARALARLDQEQEAANLARAHRRGRTSEGWALEVDVGALWREHNPSEEAPQVLGGEP